MLYAILSSLLAVNFFTPLEGEVAMSKPPSREASVVAERCTQAPEDCGCKEPPKPCPKREKAKTKPSCCNKKSAARKVMEGS